MLGDYNCVINMEDRTKSSRLRDTGSIQLTSLSKKYRLTDVQSLGSRNVKIPLQIRGIKVKVGSIESTQIGLT